jgi:hypothetical protein
LLAEHQDQATLSKSAYEASLDNIAKYYGQGKDKSLYKEDMTKFVTLGEGGSINID